MVREDKLCFCLKLEVSTGSPGHAGVWSVASENSMITGLDSTMARQTECPGPTGALVL